MADEPFKIPPELELPGSSDRACVETFLAEAEAERSRLRLEIGTARQRLLAAEAATEASSLGALARLGALVLAAHRELAEARRVDRAAVAAIEAEAEAEVKRILAAARDVVLALGADGPLRPATV